MAQSLREEIRQKQPFRSLEHEAYLNLVRTAGAVSDALEQVLKNAGITSAQYNVLRILRGAEPAGLCRNEVRDRMLTRMPDMTRLLDRMETGGLVTRTRSAEDRRVVATHVTARGQRLLAKLDDVVLAEHKRTLGHMSKSELKSLIELLTRARDRD